MTDLRSRQRALASQAVVDACAELVTERHHLDFSMKEVAERAGVSLRTVYNHFATREDLLDALGDEFDVRTTAMGSPVAADIHTPEEFLAAIRSVVSAFEATGGISEAFAQMPLADIGRDEDRVERTRVLVGLIVERMPDVPPDQARAIALMLRHLLSHRSWFWLTREYGLTTDEVGDIVTWALTTLTAAATAGDLPKGTEES